MTVFKTLAFLWALVTLGGCSYSDMLDKLAPKAEVAFAREYLAHLRAGNYDEVEKHLRATLITPDTRDKLRQISEYFPVGEPKRVELIGSHVFSGPHQWTADLSFQYEYANAWLLANIVIERTEGRLVVSGVHVNRLPDSLQRIHAFSVHLFGSGAQAAGPYAPWFVTVSFPLGAAIFLARRLKQRPIPMAGTDVR